MPIKLVQLDQLESHLFCVSRTKKVKRDCSVVSVTVLLSSSSMEYISEIHSCDLKHAFNPSLSVCCAAAASTFSTQRSVQICAVLKEVRKCMTAFCCHTRKRQTQHEMYVVTTYKHIALLQVICIFIFSLSRIWDLYRQLMTHLLMDYDHVSWAHHVQWRSSAWAVLQQWWNQRNIRQNWTRCPLNGLNLSSRNTAEPPG